MGETELMICEEEGLTKRFRMTAVVSALADKKTFREEMYQRAERFERNYKKRIRRGCGDLDHSADLLIPDVQYQFQNGISGVVDHIDHCDRALSDLCGISP